MEPLVVVILINMKKLVFFLGVIWFWILIIPFIAIFPQMFATPETAVYYLEYLPFAVALNFLFLIIYFVDIFRNKSFDFHKKLTWSVGIVLFSFIVVPIYWHKHILRKIP